MSGFSLRAAHAAVLFGALVTVILPAFAQYNSTTAGSRAWLVPKQDIEGIKEVGSKNIWNLEVTAGFPEVQCADGNVTGSFVLNTPRTVEGIIGASSTAMEVGNWTFYMNYSVVEVKLVPRKRLACTLQTSLNLILKVVCSWCKELTSTVTFSRAPTFTEMGNQYFEVTDISVWETLHTWKFTSVVHPGIRLREKGTLFTAVFSVPSFPQTQIKNFFARFRGPLIVEEAWFVEKKDNKAVVYAALEVPSAWSQQEPPTLTIDVECDGCDPKKASLTYAPERSEWKTIKNGVFMDNYGVARKNQGQFELEESSEHPQCNNKPNCYAFQSVSTNMCFDRFDGFAQVAIDSIGEVEFSWVANKKVYGAHTIRKGMNHLVRWVASHSSHPCNEVDAQISLIVICEKRPLSVRWYFPDSPWVPLGMRPVEKTQLTRWWSVSKTCGIEIKDGGSGELMKSDIIRLWHPLVAGDGRKELMLSNKIIRTWEHELSKSLSAGFHHLSGGTEKLCFEVIGIIYRFVDVRLDASDRGSTAVSIRETLYNSTLGRREHNYMVFDGVVSADRMLQPVPFLLTFCLTGRNSSSVSSVEFGSIRLVPFKVSVGAQVVECYALNSCQAWAFWDDMNFHSNFVIPRVRITGDSTIPLTIRWRLEKALRLKDSAVGDSKFTQVSRTGWYGTMEEALNYTISTDVITRKITTPDGPRCGHPMTLLELSDLKKKKHKSKAGSPVGDRVYIQPPFQVYPNMSLYSGDWHRVEMKVLFFALSAAIMLQAYDGKSPLLP